MWRSCSPRIAGPSSNGRTPDFGSGNEGSSPSGPIPTERRHRRTTHGKKAGGVASPPPALRSPGPRLRLGLVGLLLVRLLDLAIGRALGRLRIGFRQPETVECLADALAALQGVENRFGRDGGGPWAAVLWEDGSGGALGAP